MSAIEAASVDQSVIESDLGVGSGVASAEDLARLLGGMLNVASTLLMLVDETGAPADELLQEVALTAERFGEQ